jgi:hypothetical protein
MSLALAIASRSELPQKLPALADQLDVSVGDLVALLNDKAFTQLVRSITAAQANLTFHSVGVPKLVEIIQNGKDKTALGAIQTLGKLSGDLVTRKQVDVRMTFEDLRKRESASDPLGGLFDIRTDVIEAEIKEAATEDDYEEWESEQ